MNIQNGWFLPNFHKKLTFQNIFIWYIEMQQIIYSFLMI